MFLHEKYLRFTAGELSRHFADVSRANDRSTYLRYYEQSIAQSQQPSTGGTPVELAAQRRRANQIEKDERFWVVDTLMTIFHRTPDRAEAFGRLLSHALPNAQPPGDAVTWSDALGPAEDLELYFEANLPATTEYQGWLADHLSERALVPWIRDEAKQSGKKRLEGSTKTDAMLISRSTNMAVIFEAKVLSDTSVSVGYDAARNQLARTIDVMLERNPRLTAPLRDRDPDKTYLVLVTPDLFKKRRATRLYGLLLEEYTTLGSTLLAEHLEHRKAPLPTDIRQRLGWLTWEECRAMYPYACPWLQQTL